MEDKIEEGLIKGSIDIISVDKTEIILEQMKKCICKINGKKKGTGFFCKITYNNKLIPVLMTNYHIIDNDYIKNNKKILISINEEKKIINIDKDNIIYSSDNNKYDIIIIKINEDIINNYLEIDEDIFKDESEIFYKDNSIYILHNPMNNKVSVSYGYGIEKINEYYIKHNCNTELCSSGGPIINLLNNKIIGIHKGYIKKDSCNIGTYLKYPLNEINKIKNEIKLKIKIENDDMNKEIYFLDNTDGYKDENGIEHYHDNLKELNNINTELYINNIKKEYKKYFIPEKKGIYTIKLKFNIYIKDCSYMFFGCDKLTDINLSSFNISKVNNMGWMFSGCFSLKSLPDITEWDTKNVKDMSGMFGGCESLESLPDISKLDTKNVNNMRYMFYGCESLKSLPDISKWDTKNVKDMSSMFYECKSLESLPDISEWNTKNVVDMGDMFSGCESLKSLPDISKWDTQNVKDMSGMLYECISLKSSPDISKWDTQNVKDMSGMFYECQSLKSLPDISNWNTKNVNNMEDIFAGVDEKIIPEKFKIV